MENYGLIWEVFYSLSMDTQIKLVSWVSNIQEANTEAGIPPLSFPDCLYVILQTMKYLEGKWVK